MNLYLVVHASAQKITETTKSLKMYYLLFINRIYLKIVFDKVKWCTNSKWAALGHRLLNVPLASGIKVHNLHSCWRRTFWAHTVIKIVRC